VFYCLDLKSKIITLILKNLSATEDKWQKRNERAKSKRRNCTMYNYGKRHTTFFHQLFSIVQQKVSYKKSYLKLLSIFGYFLRRCNEPMCKTFQFLPIVYWRFDELDFTHNWFSQRQTEQKFSLKIWSIPSLKSLWLEIFELKEGAFCIVFALWKAKFFTQPQSKSQYFKVIFLVKCHSLIFYMSLLKSF